jgi:hypothetical protein
VFLAILAMAMLEKGILSTRAIGAIRAGYPATATGTTFSIASVYCVVLMVVYRVLLIHIFSLIIIMIAKETSEKRHSFPPVAYAIRIQPFSSTRSIDVWFLGRQLFGRVRHKERMCHPRKSY